MVVTKNSDVNDLVGCILSSEEFLVTHLLPQYMIPTRFYRFNEFPTTSNGKVDRKKLLKIVTNRDKSISDETNDNNTTPYNDDFTSLVLDEESSKY